MSMSKEYIPEPDFEDGMNVNVVDPPREYPDPVAIIQTEVLIVVPMSTEASIDDTQAPNVTALVNNLYLEEVIKKGLVPTLKPVFNKFFDQGIVTDESGRALINAFQSDCKLARFKGMAR